MFTGGQLLIHFPEGDPDQIDDYFSTLISLTHYTAVHYGRSYTYKPEYTIVDNRSGGT
jgi:hypothetical protein